MTTTTSKASYQPLPELKTGDTLESIRGKTYVVHRVRKPKRDMYDEPIYRLKNGILGNAEWTLGELEQAGLTYREET